MIFNRLLAKNFCTFALALCAFAGATIAAAGQPLAVNDPANTTAPLVRLTAPADNTELSLRTLVRGEVLSTALASWQLLAAPAGTDSNALGAWTELATGTQNTQGELGAKVNDREDGSKAAAKPDGGAIARGISIAAAGSNEGSLRGIGLIRSNQNSSQCGN